MLIKFSPFLWLLLSALAVAQEGPAGPILEQQLMQEPPVALAKAARERGDAWRGAIVFYQQQMVCTKCHTAGDVVRNLGPDLATVGKETTDVSIVESILFPSKVIRKGFETITVVTKDGKSLTGLLVEDNKDSLILRDAAQEGAAVTIAKATIEERLPSTASIMPLGLVHQLANRGQFLDLVRYLMDIAEHGPSRARELRPAPSLFAPPPLPEYEKIIDHAGLIAGQNRASFKRGEAIYVRLCINCHGTREQPGSLPTSLKFADGKFKNGSDPFRMYQTLTHGYGMMVAQSWMVPEQKYDVIHYIREEFVKDHNPSQYAAIDRAYLDKLPKGTTRGPKPVIVEPWKDMDYGPQLSGTYELGDKDGNIAYKGIAIRLDNGPGGVARGKQWVVYDHDTLRLVGAWSGPGFIDWNGISFNGKHNAHPHAVGQVEFGTPSGPGWANPNTGTFDDTRIRGRDGKPYGPLPREWAHFKGLYHHGQKVILSYTVGETEILESPEYSEMGGNSVYTRTFYIGSRSRNRKFQYAQNKAGTLFHTLPTGNEPLRFALRLKRSSQNKQDEWVTEFDSESVTDLSTLTKGGPPRWSEVLETQILSGDESGPFAIDILSPPVNNPWKAQTRLTGLDFLPGGDEVAVCAWDGDVWRVSGLSKLSSSLQWRRIASGLFQPLGLKVVNGDIYVTCRDQIVILRDLNGDGETDFYENFNSDHQVTEHFHEFAMGLQTDPAGNFYYAKSARHALTAIVPQHGTLLRVSKDGSRTDIVATGFRAANGVCLNPDGTFFVTDQEGHWNPKNRINWVREGYFYGNMFGYHNVTDSSDSAMEPPLCWITNSFDRSPAELLWVTSDAWGPLKGALLNFSYGYGKVFVVPHENLGGQWQGGMSPLPLPQFPTGIMRGRFHPVDGQLYACGMYAWAGTQQQPGGFYRIRYTGKPVHVPLALKATPKGMAITFSGSLDAEAARTVANYAVKTWSLKRTEKYGSDHYDEKPLPVSSAKLAGDGRTVLLDMPGIQPTWCMEIKYTLKTAAGQPFDSVIHNTVHRLE